MEEEENEEEEDLNDIPLFEDTSDVIVELSNLLWYQLRVLQLHLQALFWHKALI